MPQFRHGKRTGLHIEQMDGTMFDLSTYLREVNFPRQMDTPESTTFQNTTKTYVQGIPDGRFTCSGFFDATADYLLSRLAASDSPTSGDTFAMNTGKGFTIKYMPEGTTATGLTIYIGRVFISNYSVQGAVTELVAATVEFVFSGNPCSSNAADAALRRSTVSSTTADTTTGLGTAVAASFTHAA